MTASILSTLVPENDINTAGTSSDLGIEVINGQEYGKP